MHESHIFGVHSNVPALFYTTRVKHGAEDKSLNIEVAVHCVTALRATPQAPDSGPAWLFGIVWVRVHPSVHAASGCRGESSLKFIISASCLECLRFAIMLARSPPDDITASASAG